MNLKPLQDWAVIRRSEAQEKTAGGIIIPDTAKEKPLEGVIIEIGPGRYKLEKGKEKEKKKKFVPTVLRPGERVIYQKYAEREVDLGNEVITLVREEDILGTVEDYAVSERNIHAVEGKKEGSVAVREKAHVPAVTPAAPKSEKPSVVRQKTPEKKPAAKKSVSKMPLPKKETRPAGKKMSAAKKAAANKPARKTAAKPIRNTEKKSVKKDTPEKKKVRPEVKKAAAVKKKVKKVIAGKPAVKKTARQKTTKPATKKTAPRETSVKKAVKKTLKKGGKK